MSKRLQVIMDPNCGELQLSYRRYKGNAGGDRGVVILLDSNVPMYLVGAAHPNKDRAQVLLECCLRHGDELVTYAEVFQEILHLIRWTSRTCWREKIFLRKFPG